MLDINFIRQNPEKVKQACQNKQVRVDIDRLLESDRKKRELLQEIEKLRAEKNRISTAGGQALSGAKELKEKIKELTETYKKAETDFNDLMRQVPNVPFREVPVGKDEKDNVVVKKIGKIPQFAFSPKDHLELGRKLDIIDVERAAKSSGARFNYLKNEAVMLEIALMKFAFDFLIKKGFRAILPPVMIKPEMAEAMGYLEQTGDDEAYFLAKDNLYLIGTAEQAIGAMHAGEIFGEKELPRRYVGFSACFRREAGSYGKDTRGIFRSHQFDKIEMFSFCRPDESVKEHQFLLSLEEELMKLLKIPYRVIQICTGDLGKPAAQKYDIEAWLPGQHNYRETHSTSNCTDFQARRLNVRYRDKTGKLSFLHTLNGTAIAVGRTIIAMIENYQQKDGSVEMPKVLRKFAGFKKIPKR